MFNRFLSDRGTNEGHTRRRGSIRKPRSSRARKRRLAQQQANALNFETLEARHLLASVTVGNATDVVSPTADTSSITALLAADGGDGISLREAIVAANNTTGADTIDFDPSVFNGGSNSLIRLTQGELEITDTLTIDGSTGTDVTITADALGDDVTNGAFITDVSASFGGTAGAADDLLDDNSRVLNLSSSTGDLTLEGLTLTGGRTTGNNDGGGIRFNSSGSVSLTNSTVSGNSTFDNNADGGGIYTDSGAVSLTNSTVSGNSTSGLSADGGGVHTNTGGVSLMSSTVTGNRTSHDGGGIRTTSGDVSLMNSTVSGNSTSGFFADGGGISTQFGDVSLTNSTVSGNSTLSFETFGTGGGISSTYGDVSLTSSTVSGNITLGQYASGGGVYTRSGDVSLTSSTVSGNSTAGSNADGGGIFASKGSVSLTNSTVSGNSASSYNADGGGIWVYYAAVSLTNSTVSGNSTAGNGGGIYVLDSSRNTSLTIENSIVAGNTDNGGTSNLVPDPDSTLVINHSLIGSTNLTITGTGNQVGSLALPINPLLGPLAFNGGPTKTHALLPGSPAIDAGNNTTDTEDQRGSTRVVDLPGIANAATSNGADIGAFERRMTEPFTDPPVVTSIVRDDGGVLIRPDRLSTIVVTFSRDVNVSAGDLIVRNNTTLGTVVDTSGVGFSYHSPSQTARWNFSSLPNLDAAFYSFELSDDIVSVAGNLSLDGDEDGNPGVGYTESIYVAIPGDLNLDGDVDVTQIVIRPGGIQNVGDASVLLASLPTASGATYYDGDLNGDGDVDVTQISFVGGMVRNVGDASILLSNLGASVVPPAATFASTAATTPSATAAVEAIAPVAKTSVAIVLPQTGEAEINKPKQELDARRFQNADLSPTSSLAANQDLDDTFADTDWDSGINLVSVGDAFGSTNDDPLEIVFAGLND